MGTVFRAEHVKVGRTLAVKVLHPRMLEHERYRRRFDREAELAGRMRHANVVGVIDVGITAEGLRYLVMEYAEGRTLTQLIHDGPMPAPRVLGLARQLCDGLHHAHEHGLIHRDLKPDNVIVERDRHGEEAPRILDFGIAIALADFSAGERERLTTEGMVLGTPHYMAPEHASGQGIDHRIDLFALGVMCYEMLAGVMPFDGTGVEVARSYLTRSIPPMRQRAPRLEIDPLLEAFTRALLARKRDERPPSAKAARALLELIAHDRAAAARELGVKLADQRRTLPVSPAPPPARPPGGTKPPLSATWNQLPTEKMSPDPEAPGQRALAIGVAETEPAFVPLAPVTGEGAVAPREPSEQAAATAPTPREALAGPERAAATAPLRREELVGSVALPEIGPPVAPAPAAPGSEISPASAISSVSLAPLGALGPATPHRSTELVRPLMAPQRWWPLWVAAGLVGLGLCALAAVGLRDEQEPAPAARSQAPSPPPAPRVAAAPEPAATVPARAAPADPRPSSEPAVPAAPPPAGAIAPAATAPTATAPPATAPAPAPTAPAPASPSIPRPAPRTPAPPSSPPPAPAPAPAAPTQSQPAPADPTSAAVADLYGAVGRALKRLDETHGQQATYDLWPRFRRIQILEALRSRDARVAAHEELRFLEREIELRAR